MNLRQPYEQLIASKLRQLPAPDADTSWQQMKRLLDDDEDTRAGGRKRPPGNNGGWWRIGIIAIVLSASFWLYVEKKPTPGAPLSKNNTAASPGTGNKPGEANNTTNSNKNQTATIDNTTTLTGSNTNTVTANNKENSYAAADKSVAGAIKNNSIKKSGSNSKTAAKNSGPLTDQNDEGRTNTLFAGNTTSKHKGNNGIKNNMGNAGTPKDFAGILLSPKENKTRSGQHAAGNDINDNKTNTSATGDTDDYIAAVYTSGQQTHKVKQGSGKRSGNNIQHKDKAFITADDNIGRTAPSNYGPVNQPVVAREKTWLERLTELKASAPSPSFNTSLSAGDSIADSRDISLNNETKKLVARAQRDKAIELLDKKEKKSFHLNLSNVFKPFSMHLDAEPWWAAGIALNSGITVNAQNRYNYNVNAKSSIISDYIPSPYLQFHLNNYVYLQTELNFITPQYTPSLLIYRQSNEITAQAGMSRQKSIYIQKLYYFNWPLSLHYSPVSNLYFSGGIQFSSFQSGLASIEEKEFTTALGPDHASSASTTVLKFKDDSIAAKIAPNEWRWQVGAEYYWNRFSVGLRYNQSFKNAINATVSPVLPPTISRNESLLFFVRYNLFESKQKESAPKNQ